MAREMAHKAAGDSRSSNVLPEHVALLPGYSCANWVEGAVMSRRLRASAGARGSRRTRHSGPAGTLDRNDLSDARGVPDATVSLRRRISGGGRTEWGQPITCG